MVEIIDFAVYIIIINKPNVELLYFICNHIDSHPSKLCSFTKSVHGTHTVHSILPKTQITQLKSFLRILKLNVLKLSCLCYNIHLEMTAISTNWQKNHELAYSLSAVPRHIAHVPHLRCIDLLSSKWKYNGIPATCLYKTLTFTTDKKSPKKGFFQGSHND